MFFRRTERPRDERAHRAAEAQARYARRKGETVELPTPDASGFEPWKIVDVVRGDDHAPVILHAADGGRTMTIAALRLERYETAAGAAGAPGGATVVGVADIPGEPKETVKIRFHERYGAVDLSQGVETGANDAAEEELHREKNELRGVSGFLLRVVKHNIGYEITRQLGLNRARTKILQQRDVYAHQDGTRVEHDAATAAVLDRFLTEHEEYMHKEGKDGERRKMFGETDAEKSVKKQMNDLVREYASTPAMTDEELYARRGRIFKEAGQLSGEAKGDGLMYADNLKDIAEQVRIAARHAGGIDNLDIDLDFVVGKAKLGARTEHEKGTVDSVLEKMQSWGQRHTSAGAIVGAFRNEIAVAVAATVGIGTVLARTALSSTAANVLTFGGAGMVTGLYGWWKEKGRLNRERSLHERQMALGGNIAVQKDFTDEQNTEVERRRAELLAEYEAMSVLRPVRRLELRRQIEALKPEMKPRRETMEKFAMERSSARDMSRGGNAFLTPSGELMPGADPAIVMKALSEMDARVRISNTEKVDLLTYSSAVHAEQERRDLDRTRMMLRAALRASNPEFQTQYDETYRLTADDIYGNKESGVKATNEKFGRYAGRAARRRGLATAVIGMGVGYVAHEIYVLATDGETVTGSLGRAALWLKGYFLNEAPVESVDEPVIEHIGDGVMSTPNGTRFVPQEDGTFTLESVADQKVLASGIHIGADGTLDTASRNALENIGATVVETEATIDHTETITERVGVWDWLHEHAPSVTHITRDIWLGNDTPASEFDFNEQGLDWGDVAGVNANGDFVMDMDSMVTNGSWQGTTHVDVLSAMALGKMRLVLTMSEGSQNHAIEIVVNPQGEAIIPADSDIAHTFFAVDHGRPVFLGKYAEIALSKGFDEKGTDHLMILATHVGKGLQEGVSTRDIGECVTEHVTEIGLPANGPFPTLVMPPVIPIRSRRPLERLSPKRDMGTNFQTMLNEEAGRAETGVPTSVEAREGGDYAELLRNVARAGNTSAACAQLLRTVRDTVGGTLLDRVNGLVLTALNDIDEHGEAMKALVMYAYHSHLQGERFFKHPIKDETLFVDDDGELISFQGEIATISKGLQGEGMNYIKSLEDYEVLTGPNKGKKFNGGVDAHRRGDLNSRPLRGPDITRAESIQPMAVKNVSAVSAPTGENPVPAVASTPKRVPRLPRIPPRAPKVSGAVSEQSTGALPEGVPEEIIKSQGQVAQGSG